MESLFLMVKGERGREKDMGYDYFSINVMG